MTLEQLITQIGTSEVARTCGVSRQNVHYWKKHGMPSRPADKLRRQEFERRIAKLAGMNLKDLRAITAQKGAAKAA